MYEITVISPFRCKESKEIYKKDDTYRHDSAARVSSLMKQGFLQQKDLKEDTAAAEENTSLDFEHVGGGFYQLPDGSKVKGKKAAAQKLEELRNGSN